MQPVAAKLSDRLAARGSPWARPALYAALCLLSFAAYHGFTHAWLFNDDFSWLREARHEMHPATILTHRVVDFFRPLVNLSFWASERLWR